MKRRNQILKYAAAIPVAVSPIPAFAPSHRMMDYPDFASYMAHVSTQHTGIMLLVVVAALAIGYLAIRRSQ